MYVKVSQRAMKAMESLPRDVQEKACRAVELLKTDNERSVKPQQLKGGRGLFYGRLNTRFRIVYSKKQDEITIVDFVDVENISKVMRFD
ncbi:type II toxin-antitoxin system RelE family toxin [Vibrio parahaemolyticus]|uniref:type II toxin-antitoxin system RelE family toxin n=1 Tax=Vibrio parahaemolyticus TaxID=670 RepID=UPI0011206053|nr:hypothetical protein [Vibrio parahaemolyticus]ELA8137666.1 hypothetical protein [Vibrio parahaemolyticus]MDF4476297.1 hypothetical protein [Vibrio parahaemolyticus]MDF4480798.1 hypothetical protein [Vibrio parahaemolyticus]MDG3409191.1 hypothetical protein [Vibrio parahaemolyticus]MUT64152.1 hypothetical protein [Vibrio parahaemolyticus]